MIKLRPHKLLVIDEINYTRLVLSQALVNDGFKVVTAQNSGEAMQHISTELPDVILLSLRTTDTSGIPALRTLKDYFRLRLDVAHGAEPAIITLSDLRDTRQAREVQALGVSQSLSKPINIQELLNTVRMAIANKSNVIQETRMKIMFFDGETRSQQFLESVISHEMYDIDASETEAEFLARVKNRRYDLSIIDLTSFESNIIETLKSIKEMTEPMPIMTIATSADQISQEELKKLGVHIHFIKPLDIAIFREEVDAVLKEQGEIEENEGEEEPEEAEKEADDLQEQTA